MPSLPHCTRTQHSRCRRRSSWALSDPWRCRRSLVRTESTRPGYRRCTDRWDTVVPSTAPLQPHNTNQQQRHMHQSTLAMSHLRRWPQAKTQRHPIDRLKDDVTRVVNLRTCYVAKDTSWTRCACRAGNAVLSCRTQRRTEDGAAAAIDTRGTWIARRRRSRQTVST